MSENKWRWYLLVIDQRVLLPADPSLHQRADG